MNLRTHTFAIPAMSGLAAFALLVTADYSFRRMLHGEGYGFAAYVTDVNERPDFSARAAAAPALAVVPVAAEPVADEPELIAEPAFQSAPMAMPREDVAEQPPLPVLSLPDPAPVVQVMAEDRQTRQLVCEEGQGFKRCRVGN